MSSEDTRKFAEAQRHDAQVLRQKVQDLHQRERANISTFQQAAAAHTSKAQAYRADGHQDLAAGEDQQAQQKQSDILQLENSLEARIRDFESQITQHENQANQADAQFQQEKQHEAEELERKLEDEKDSLAKRMLIAAAKRG